MEISVLVHATEDEEKVLSGIKNFLKTYNNSIKIESSKTSGHWKNPIKIIKIHLDRHVDKIYSIIQENLASNYGNLFDNYLQNNVDDKGSVYIRLNKQSLSCGRISLADNDSIRLTFKKKGKFEK